MKLHPKIEVCLYKSIHALPFFWELLQFTSFEESNEVPTMGTYLQIKGIKILYNSKFVDSLEETQVMFVLIHELLHNVYNHMNRVKDRDMQKSNMIQDMIINSCIKDDVANERLNKQYKNLVVSPDSIDSKSEFKGYYIPEEYREQNLSETFENLYAWFQEKVDERKQSGKDKNDDLGEESNTMVDEFENSDDKNLMDVHGLKGDDLPESLKEQVMKDIIENIKGRGFTSSDVESILSKLRPKKHNWFSIFKKSFESVSGNSKYNTWTRPNRKDLPTKGYRKMNNDLNIILDTSGSMSDSFTKVLNHIYGQNYIMNIIQCDTNVKSVKRIENKQALQKIKIKGLGGTVLQPSIDFINKDKKLNKLPTVLLTDGDCDTLNISKLQNKFMVLTTSSLVDFSGSKKAIKQIKIEAK